MSEKTKKITLGLIVALTLYGAAVTVVFGLLAFINPAMISPDKTMNVAALFYANHFAARNMVIALLMLLPLLLKDKRLWAFAMLIRGMTESMDSILELIETRRPFPGLIFAVFAVLFLASAVYLFRISKEKK